MNTQRLAKLQTTGLYLLIFLFTLLWLTACSVQAKIHVAQAPVNPAHAHRIRTHIRQQESKLQLFTACVRCRTYRATYSD